MRRNPIWILLTLLLATGGGALAAEAPLEVVTLPVAKPAPPPLRLAEGLLTAPAATLPPAAEGAADQLAALIAWNRGGHLPQQDGFVRGLVEPFRVALDGGMRSAAKRFAVHAGGYLGETAGGHIAPGEDNLRAGVEQRGTDGKERSFEVRFVSGLCARASDPTIAANGNAHGATAAPSKRADELRRTSGATSASARRQRGHEARTAGVRPVEA